MSENVRGARLLWERDQRPITEAERPHLKALGLAIRNMRRAAGLTLYDLASGAGISTAHLARVGSGDRRTKRSTLSRLVAIAVEANPDLGPAELLLDQLCEIAGPAIVVDTTGPIQPIPVPTEEDLRRLFDRWWRLDRATKRARHEWYAADGRLRRLEPKGENW